MMEMLFMIVLLTLVLTGFCFDPPSYVSPWILMNSSRPDNTSATFTHGLGVLPAMVEVQVKSEATGYIYQGVKSAYASNVTTPRGGVVYNYDETVVRLYGATDYGQPAYIIYTGVTSWANSDYQEVNTTGLVRVRAWAPSNLPDPSFIEFGFERTFYMNAGRVLTLTSSLVYVEIEHGFNQYPVLSVVQYTPSDNNHPLYGWNAEAQGSSSRPIAYSDSIWGGLVYAVDERRIRLWAPSTDQSNGSLYSFCGGWGGMVTRDCGFDEATVTVKLWRNLGNGLTFNYTQSNHAVSPDPWPYHNYTVYPLLMFDMDSVIITGAAVATSDVNAGFEFPASGAAMMDGGPGTGGFVFGYTDYMLSFRFFHPNVVDFESYIIFMSGLANGEMTQNAIIADLRIRILIPQAAGVPVDFCLEQFMPSYPGTFTSENQTYVSSRPWCIVTYECLSGYVPDAGGLVRLYNQYEKTWNDTAPNCIDSNATTTNMPTTTTTESPTECVCFNDTNITLSEIIAIAQDISSNLTINPKTTSKYMRTLVSSDDYRLSAKVIGVIGAVVCAVSGALVLMSDVTSIFMPKPSKVSNAKSSKGKPRKEDVTLDQTTNGDTTGQMVTSQEVSKEVCD